MWTNVRQSYISARSLTIFFSHWTDLDLLLATDARGCVGGLRCAGTVVGLGTDVDHNLYKVGTEVLALVQPSKKCVPSWPLELELNPLPLWS